MKITDVAVAVFMKPDGSFLLSSRPSGKPYAGYWEFPGGKIEPNETVRDALRRELIEELNVVIDDCMPWFSFMMHYEHATVRLHTWRVTAWHDVDAYGMRGMEGQAFTWQTSVDAITVAPTLPGCVPIFRALQLPTITLITNASEMGTTAYLSALNNFLNKNASNAAPVAEFQASPVKHFMIQIREKSMPRDALKTFAREVIAMAKEHRAITLINSDIALADELHADGVHLTSAQLSEVTTRPDCAWVGASAHTREEIEHAAHIGADFAVLGAVKPTQSHPGQAPLGWPQFATIVHASPIPVFAIGGMMTFDLETAMRHGAHGIAMQRAIVNL
jgi:8-oxo-dGTP diphosphatase